MSGNSWSWIPDFTESGQYEIFVEVTDGVLTDNQTVYITVLESGNHAPIFNAVADQSVLEGELFALQVTAIDPDEDTLVYSLVNPPVGMEINDVTGDITWTPFFDQVGDHTITVKADDGDMSSTVSFILTVINLNNPPIPGVLFQTGMYVYNGEPFNITVSGTGTNYNIDYI